MLKNNYKITFFLLLCLVGLCVYAFASADEDFVYDPMGKRDPFAPLVTPDGRLLKVENEQSTTGVGLEGIIYDKNGISYAIVNGDVAKIGDMVGDYEVLRIEGNKVVFIKNGEPLELELNKEGQ